MDGKTPLHLAIYNCKKAIVTMFLETFKDRDLYEYPNIPDDFGFETPLPLVYIINGYLIETHHYIQHSCWTKNCLLNNYFVLEPKFPFKMPMERVLFSLAIRDNKISLQRFVNKVQQSHFRSLRS